MKLLVCGGAGFIGSNFIRYMLETYPHIEVVNFDKLTYAGNPENLLDLEATLQYSSRYTFIKGDICDFPLMCKVVEQYGITHLINFAAETHVDRSIHGDCSDFVMTNTYGVLMLLNLVKKYKLEKYVNVSTDEVYGTLQLGDQKRFTESTPIEPNMPYAAAKAGGDLLCRAMYATHGLPVVVTHCSNNYGPYQFPEKLVPISVFRLLKNQPIMLHGDGLNVRDWVHVRDHASALDLMLREGVPGEVYNVGADNERNNIEIAKIILQLMNKPESMLDFVEDRPGNDRRYAIDASKIMHLGWKPIYTREKFEIGMSETINWYLTNREWVKNLWAKQEEANTINHAPTLQKKKDQHKEDVLKSK